MSNSDSTLTIYNPDTAVQGVTAIAKIVQALYANLFVEGQDYGAIPGTGDKPTLLLPGMEKLLRALRLRPEYHAVGIVEDFDKPLFMYRYECRLIEADSGVCIATAIGSANSREDKWGIRWVEKHDLNGAMPIREKRSSIVEPAFAIDKAETTGKYGKPQSYWDMWKVAIENGTAQLTHKVGKNNKTYEAYQLDSVSYAILNERIYDQINTIDKIAQKRALSSAIKIAANVSQFFTVDLEDMVQLPTTPIKVEKDDVKEGEYSEDLPHWTTIQSQHDYTVNYLFDKLGFTLGMFEYLTDSRLEDYKTPEIVIKTIRKIDAPNGLIFEFQRKFFPVVDTLFSHLNHFINWWAKHGEELDLTPTQTITDLIAQISRIRDGIGEDTPADTEQPVTDMSQIPF